MFGLRLADGTEVVLKALRPQNQPAAHSAIAGSLATQIGLLPGSVW